MFVCDTISNRVSLLTQTIMGDRFGEEIPGHTSADFDDPNFRGNRRVHMRASDDEDDSDSEGAEDEFMNEEFSEEEDPDERNAYDDHLRSAHDDSLNKAMRAAGIRGKGVEMKNVKMAYEARMKGGCKETGYSGPTGDKDVFEQPLFQLSKGLGSASIRSRGSTRGSTKFVPGDADASMVSGLSVGLHSTRESTNSGVSAGTFISCGSTPGLSIVDAKTYLCMEGILEEVKKACCTRGCLLSLCKERSNGNFTEGCTLVFQARNYLRGYTKNERRQALRSIFVNNCVVTATGQLGSTRCNYFIPVHKDHTKVEVCSAAFKRVYGITKHTRASLLSDMVAGNVNGMEVLDTWTKVSTMYIIMCMCMCTINSFINTFYTTYYLYYLLHLHYLLPTT
jgi:hypothetical protein